MEELRRRWSSGEVKMAVTAGCLAARRIAREALAPHARYLPLDAEGPMQRSVLAWSRLADHAAVEHGAVEHGASAPAVIAVVTRLASLLDAAEDDLPAGKRSYGETRVSVPRELRGVFTDVLSGKTVDASAGSFAVAEALEELPVALLVRSPSS